VKDSHLHFQRIIDAHSPTNTLAISWFEYCWW